MATHELHFTIDDGTGTPGGGLQGEVPMRGEMDHLPNQAGLPPNNGQQAPSMMSVQYIQQKLNQSAHPTVCVFHMLFKGVALFLYIFGGWFNFFGGGSGAHFISLTVFIILLLAADFWVVKNVTGRLLVGLRWWNKVNDDSTTWIFESAEDKVINPFDRSFFWTILYATPVAWVALLLLAILKFELNWLMVCGIAIALSGSNVYGYYKCSSDQKARFQQMMERGAQQGAVAMMRSSMLSMLTGSGNNNAGMAAGAAR